jgi:tRNA-splicing ligase RtcB (3'-phosphate/5'-hydroxy nucleic acid ligase)
MDLRRIDDVTWEVPRTGGMRVPGRVFLSKDLLQEAQKALEQVRNVAHLPGIVEASFAMPDIHWGYGFPIGGVAATDVDTGGVISPGGVGFDIGCGVRLLGSGFTEPDFRTRQRRLMDELDRRIPRGLGKGAVAAHVKVDDVLEEGVDSVLSMGFGVESDQDRCEEHGRTPGADRHSITDRAKKRGSGQLGSLGAGNHFLEIQVVDEIFEEDAAKAFGLAEGMVCVMIHCGSRGLGHQTCTDQLDVMRRSSAAVDVPDRQLASVPLGSEEGRGYLAAMASAANFAWANRHVLAHEARRAFSAAFATQPNMPLVFDVAHNLAKVEEHDIDGVTRRLCVHRKGATRAFGPEHPGLASDLRSVGQPVLVPGSMGTASWVLAGVDGNPAFESAAHGAGRMMSRKQAKRTETGAHVRDALEHEGIAVRPGSVQLLSEEAPWAYKDVDEVVEVCELAHLARKVARLRPLGVVKG